MATNKETPATEAKPAPEEKVSIEVTAKKVKIGSMWCGKGAKANLSKSKADKLIKAGDAIAVY